MGWSIRTGMKFNRRKNKFMHCGTCKKGFSYKMVGWEGSMHIPETFEEDRDPVHFA